MNKTVPTSSSFKYQWTYDVFINFRGEDTRHGFTGHLYNALKKAGVRTFFDDEEIRRGDEITPTLIKAIENSRMAITVFSKNYASSTFCLNELVKIHECIKMKGQLVLPIFYDVEPSEVRHQKKNYKQALSMHIKNLRADGDKIQSWKFALHEVANISGDHFVHGQNDYEYQFIERIVKEISSKINRVPLHVSEYPIGLESRVKEITSLLQIESNEEAIMIGICGMGGSGKTTIARALYNSIADNFQGLSFVHDVKEKSKKLGLERIQETILSNIVGVDIKIQDVNEGVEIIKKRFKENKILLILDDVDNGEQLKMLAGGSNWFNGASRIIITTRDGQLLVSHGVQSIYNMEAFNPEESLELLSWNAFRNHQVDPSYKDVLIRAIIYAQGLPVALEIIGANLYGMSISEWKSALDLYERIPEENILQRLKVSYDCLSKEQQNIFLDIACFFNGLELEHAKFMVQKVNDFNPEYVIRVLVNKCLMKIVEDTMDGNIIEMHDLIRDMGKEIVRQESPNNPGERSRLWFHQDISDVLEDNTGTDKIRMIIQDNSSECIKVEGNGKAFKNMRGLKILNFHNVEFSESPKYLPNSLRVLKWEGYPSSSLPPTFNPKKLVVLDIGYGNLSSLEIIKTSSTNLGVLNLICCQNVIKIPDLSNLQNLKEFKLIDCKNLTEIHDSIGNLANLEILDVIGCGQLKTFPSAIRSPFLRELELYGCSSLKNFPELLEEVKVKKLYLFRTGIEKLPFSIRNLSELRELVIGKSVKEIPNSIFLLPKLKGIRVEGKVKISSDPMEAQQQQAIQIKEHHPCRVHLRSCDLSDDDILTTLLTRLINVGELDLTGNNFTILPSCIEQCLSLKILKLNYCKHLRDVEGIPPRIERLEATNCTSLSSDSKCLILSEELHGDPCRHTLGSYNSNKDRYYFCVPSRSMPEWIEHRSKGASLSFWFHKSFTPTLCLCFLFKPQDDFLYSHDSYPPSFIPLVFINGQEVGSLDMQSFDVETLKKFDDHHLVVYHLTENNICYYINNDDDDDDAHECNPEEEDKDDDEIEEPLVDDIIDYKIERHEWLHVKVEVEHDDSMIIEESGMYVIKQLRDMQHISFHNPYELLDSTSSDQEQFDTRMMKEKEGPLNKKRRLTGNGNFASSSTMFGCTEGGKDTSIINELDNSANENTHNKGAHLIDMDLNTTLPMLPWREHACDTFTNQGHSIEDDQWLSLDP